MVVTGGGWGCIVCSIYVLANFASPTAKEKQNIHCIYFMVIFVSHLWNVLVLHCERLGWRHAKKNVWVCGWWGDDCIGTTVTGDTDITLPQSPILNSW